jgi:hypothetical protein
MENTSKESKAIPRRDRAYYRRRNQNRIHAAVASFFAEEAAAGRITKKQLADLIEKNPAQITRWLTEPSNYEADTISDLLLAMKAEMEHRVVRFAERGQANYEHPLATKLGRSRRLGELKASLVVENKPFEKTTPKASNSKAVVFKLEPA